MREHKVLEATNLKFVMEGPGSFSGYASTFSNFDRVGERVVKGAFVPHIEAFLKDGFIAAGHDWKTAIATPRVAREDDIGLYIEADFHSTQAAQEVRAIMQERLARQKSVKLSIGYEVLASEDTEEGRLLKELKLFEVSVVTVPANPLAIVTDAKSSREQLGFNDHAEALVAANKAFAERVRERIEYREKEGRVLSASNMTTMRSWQDSLTGIAGGIGELLEVATPKRDAEKSKAEVERLRLEVLRRRRRTMELQIL